MILKYARNLDIGAANSIIQQSGGYGGGCSVDMYGVWWMLTQYPCPHVAAWTDGERRKRDTQRAKRQFDMKEFETAAEERNPVGRAENRTSKRAVEDEGGLASAVGSGFNPENPNHVTIESFCHCDCWLSDCKIFQIGYLIHMNLYSKPVSYP